MSAITNDSHLRHDGQMATWRECRDTILEIAATASALFTYGLLGFLLPAVEYATVTLAPHVPFVDVGQVQPAQAQPWKIWNYSNNQFIQQTKDLFAFKTILLAMLSQDLLDFVKVPGQGFRQLSIAQLLAAADLMYAALTTNDVTANERFLDEPFVDDGTQKVSSFVAAQRRRHHTSAENGQILPPATMVRYLRAAMVPCNQFTTVIERFEATYPTVALQTFDLLAAMLTTYDNSRAKTDTVGNLKYAAAAVARNRAPGLAVHDAAANVTDFAALAIGLAPHLGVMFNTANAVVNTPKHAARRRGGAGGAVQQPAAAGTLLYCWTHGQCFHPGKACKFKEPGHRDEATLAQPLGGETGIWEEIKLAQRLEGKRR